MRAVRIHAHGGVDQLRYEDAPEPLLHAPTEAIVRLKAAAVNRADIRIRRGLAEMNPPLPHILGSDGAGIVAEIGTSAENIKAGDAVCLYPASGCGRCEFCLTERDFMCVRRRLLGEGDEGTYAEYVRVPARNCFPLARGLSFDEAAALPTVYLTLWRMLVTHAELKPGEHVLILDVGEGVALAALQIAAHMGAHIIVTAGSPETLLRAKALGAEHGINHNESDFAKATRQLTGKRGVDVVVDATGSGNHWVRSLASLARGGRLVSCGATTAACAETDVRRVFWHHLKIFGSTLGSREEFRRVLSFMEASAAKPIIDRVFPLREAAAAQKRLEQGESFGKIVLRIDD